MRDSARGARLLVLEMALIAFAVVLGFAVTNWDTTRRERDRARVAVERIRTELDRNASGLGSAAPYYGEMAQRLDSILVVHGDAAMTSVAIPGWRGLRPPPIRTAFYQVAMETGALEHADVAIVGEIALAYEILENFSDAIDHALGTLMAGDLTQVSDWEIVFALLSELSGIAGSQARSTLELLASR